MAKYVTVVWTDPKTGETKRTTTQDPGKVESQVSQMGGILKTQEVTPLQSGRTGRTIGTYTAPTPTRQTVRAPSLHQSLKPSVEAGYIGSPIKIIAEKGKPETGVAPFTGSQQEVIRTSTVREAALIKDIKPETSYIMGGETVLGSTVISSVKSQEEQFRTGIKKYPEGSKFTFTPITSGYTVKEPDTRLGFAKEVSKQMKGKPPILKQISEIGTGITYSAYSLAQIPVRLLGKEKEFNLGFSLAMAHSLHPTDKKWINKAGALYKTTGQGIYMPTVLDVAFEPLGLAPKGTTKFLKENPFVSAGSIGGEVGLMMGFTAGISGISSKVVKPALKVAVKTTPSVYSKMATTFPKAFGKPMLTESGKTIGHTALSRSASKIAQTGFSKNIYGWVAKGWKPGKVLVYRSLGEPVKRGGLLLQKGKFVAEKGSGRIWLTAGEVAKYESRIASSGILNIGFPTSKSVVGYGKAIGASEGFIWKRTLRGTLKKAAYTSTMHKKLGVSVGRLVDDEPVRYGLGSYVRGKGVVSPVLDIGVKPDKWFSSVKSMYTHGYAYRFSTLESGKQIVDFTKGFGRGISRPLPKKWITKKLQLGLIKSQEATASLISKSKTVLKYRARSISPASIVSKVPSQVVPSLAFSVPGYMTARVTTGYLSELKTTQASRQIQLKQLIPAQMQERALIPVLSKAVIPMQIQKRVPISISSLKVTTKQTVKLDVPLKQVVKAKTVSMVPFIPSPRPVSITPLIPLIPFPRGDLFGRGRGSYDEAARKKKYKFRKFDIGGII